MSRKQVLKGIVDKGKAEEAQRKKEERERKKKEKENNTNAGKWNCVVCTFENTKAKKKCQMCQAPKPAPKRVADDDAGSVSSKRIRTSGGGTLAELN